MVKNLDREGFRPLTLHPIVHIYRQSEEYLLPCYCENDQVGNDHPILQSPIVDPVIEHLPKIPLDLPIVLIAIIFQNFNHLSLTFSFRVVT